MAEPVPYPLDVSGNPINPRLLAAMAALRASPNRATGQAFYQALHSAMLIVPEHGALDSRTGPVYSVSKEPGQLRVRVVEGPKGMSVLPVFTDIGHVRLCFRAGTLVTALPARVIARFVASDPALGMVLNPGPDPRTASVVPGQFVEWVAQGLTELP